MKEGAAGGVSTFLVTVSFVNVDAVDLEVASNTKRNRDHTENSFSSPWERGG